jgi:arylsulfatase A-like enzyme
MGRKVLFITTDQQRFDSLGCNGNPVARTPTIDRLAAEGVNYQRAYNQNTVCMPARSTMLTGQYVRTHGVVANGVPLPVDAPSVAAHLREKAGYRTALLGKAHFEPGYDPSMRWEENRRPAEGDIGPWRGFDTAINVLHTAILPNRTPASHYGRWIEEHHPEHLESFAPLLSAKGGGDTGAPETKNNPIPREWYHTDWVADHTVGWLDSLDADDDWFCWMSFPDPHHPWDPPSSELGRFPWKDIDLPPGRPDSPEAIAEVLAQKPAHWLGYYDGSFMNLEGGPASFKPRSLTDDQLREINAKTHVMNELIDDAVKRVLARIDARGWLEDTDVIFTTDHGELQGDYGLIYKGPYHTDALMRLPMIWRPAPSAGLPAGVTVDDPVGQVDLAPTFCAIAGVAPADWMQGVAFPVSNGEGNHERAICEWDSQFPQYGMHLRSLYRDGWLCTVYEKSTGGQPNGLEKVGLVRRLLGEELVPMGVQYEGTEGELYNVVDDPHQFTNLWDDPARQALKADLISDLYDTLDPLPVRTLEVEAPA